MCVFHLSRMLTHLMFALQALKAASGDKEAKMLAEGLTRELPQTTIIFCPSRVCGVAKQ